MFGPRILSGQTGPPFPILLVPPLSGHLGFSCDIASCKATIFLVGPEVIVMSFVSSCHICQQAKVDRTKLPRLLQPLEVSNLASKIISMDFI
jgi:hypothetical protein